MSDLLLYGWPITALGIAFSVVSYLWWESRRVDRAIAEGETRARLARQTDPASSLK